MEFSGFGKDSGPTSQAGAETPAVQFPRPPSPSPSPTMPISSRLSPINMDQPPTPSPGPNYSPLPVAAPEELHQSDADEEDENIKQLRECSSIYLALQDCLMDSNRNWKACQKEVQALMACNERRKK